MTTIKKGMHLAFISVFLILHTATSTVPVSDKTEATSDGTGTISMKIKPKFLTYGYYPEWIQKGFLPEKIPNGYFDGIFHAFIWPDKDGHLIIPESFKDKGSVSTFFTKGKLSSISIGGWDNSAGFKGMAENPAARKVFIEELSSFIKEYGYNGIDLDWEYPIGAKQSADFISLAKEIRSNIRGILLTTALPISIRNSGVEDIRGIADAFDYILVMAYDIEDGSDGYAGHNSPLYPNDKMPQDLSIDNLLKMNYIDAGINKDKLLLGIPLYGRKYDAISPYQEVGDSMDIPYKDIPFDGCRKSYEGGPVLMCDDHYFSYDDTKSIQEKIRYAKDLKMGGVFFWAIGQDDNEIIYPLRNKINRPTKKSAR